MKKNALLIGLLEIFFAGMSICTAYTEGYTLVERTNLRRFVNGSYVGLTSREVRSFISPADPPDATFAADQWYDGNFYVVEETLRNQKSVNTGIHDSVPSLFHISPQGKLTMVTDNGYPSFRSFPAFPAESVKPGERWRAAAERAVDPMNKGIFTRLPIYVEYECIDTEQYHGQSVYRIRAMWQTTYGGSAFDPKGDPDLKKALGGNKADILVREDTRAILLVLDTVDEQFVYGDGTAVAFRGTITLFTEYPPAVPHTILIPALQRIATVTPEAADTAKAPAADKTPAAGGAAPKTPAGDTDGSTGAGGAAPGGAAAPTPKPASNDILVEKTKAGLRLSIRNIRFKADTADIVPEEKTRLDEIAKVLSLTPGSQFLIEGHTASVGKPAGEMELSELRARRIAEELVKRGIPAQSFICRAWGGTKPVAGNDTEAGRAQNRRVEITILE